MAPRAFLIAVLGILAVGCVPVEAPPPRQQVADILGATDTGGYARALEPREFTFPADHGPHPDFRHEWWYFTGNLADADGRRFGYELTFFRTAVNPKPVEGRSPWRTRQVYLGHFAVTDVEGKRFRYWERFSRGALGLAGAQSPPFAVWLENWRVEALPGRGACEGCPVLRLTARADDVSLDLELAPAKPPVLQGDRGLSRKGPTPGNASYYYSLTRLDLDGDLVIGSSRHRVLGRGWMDREWSTSALEQGQVGWDWFALQLDDGRDVMFYRIRRDDGSIEPLSAGTVIGVDGKVERLTLEDVSLESTGEWTSPRTGIVYPSGWRVAVPRYGLDLTISPVLDDQELSTTFTYWEGAVDIRGRSGDEAVTGRGYVELAGYDSKE